MGMKYVDLNCYMFWINLNVLNCFVLMVFFNIVMFVLFIFIFWFVLRGLMGILVLVIKDLFVEEVLWFFIVKD